MRNPADHDGHDPWLGVPYQGGAVQTTTPDHTALQIAIIEDVPPLDAQLGTYPKLTVPAALDDALFGQPPPSKAEIKAAGGDATAVPPMQTYALLEAGKVTNLPELLEDSGLDHRCLFQGQAFEKLKNVAPWIVRLDPGNIFTRNLFTRSDAYWHLWDSEPGIYLRSRGTLDDMCRHLRKFTRVPDENGKTHFFRIWNHHVFLAWMLETDWPAAEVPTFFSLGKGNFIDMAMALDAPDGTAWQISARSTAEDAPTGKQFKISDQDTPVFRRALVRPLAVQLVPELRDEYAQTCADHSRISLQFAIERALMRLHAYGFYRHDILKQLVVQDIYLGYAFENEDATGSLARICRSDAPQEARYLQLCDRMQEIACATRLSGVI